MTAVALTVAGSDSGGGAGISADLATFAALGVWGTAAITAVTAQNTAGVRSASVLDPALVVAQMEAVAEDFTVDAVKIGMLGNVTVAAAVLRALADLRLPDPVLDPVLVSSSGTLLLERDAIAFLRDEMLPRAAVVTPNADEAAAMTGIDVAGRDGMADAAQRLVALGCPAVLVTGGHVAGAEVADCLVERGGDPVWFVAPRIETGATHGTGCVLSSAIAALLARGLTLTDAARHAQQVVGTALRAGLDLGAGPGPVDPLVRGQRVISG